MLRLPRPKSYPAFQHQCTCVNRLHTSSWKGGAGREAPSRKGNICSITLELHCGWSALEHWIGLSSQLYRPDLSSELKAEHSGYRVGGLEVGMFCLLSQLVYTACSSPLSCWCCGCPRSMKYAVVRITARGKQIWLRPLFSCHLCSSI